MATESERRSSFSGTIKGSNGGLTLSSDSDMNGLDENGLNYSHEYDCRVGSSSWNDNENGTLTGNGDLSPSSLRRSTRACAIKAAEKIKLKESLTAVESLAPRSVTIRSLHGDGYVTAEEDNDEIEIAVKKKRLAIGEQLDQTDCKFGIKIADDEVILMSDESDYSSLNEVELEQVKKVFDKVVQKDLTEEQKKEREIMLKSLEADLRLEEAKLTMLKKLRLSQQVSVKQLQEANVRKMTANVAQNGSGHAYKPPIAAAPSRNNNTHGKATVAPASVSSRAAATAAAALMNLTPQQQQLLQNAAKSGLLNTAAAHALLQQAQQQVANGRVNQQAAALAAAAALTQQHARATPQSSSAQSPAQKAAAAKLALRRQLEQQLLQIPAPRPPPPEMLFIPNGNQPDFCCLLGLDIVVQRILKDKNATRRVTEEPYICEECGVDYTPSWRGIGTDENSLHLYCEACVKAAQKKKMRQDHTALLRRAFNKVLEKEQELERQISEEKYESSVPSSSSTHSSGTPAATPPPCSTPKLATVPVPSSATATAATKSISSSPSTAHHHVKLSHKRPATTTSSSNTTATSSSSAQATSVTQNAAAAAAAAIAAAAGGSNASLLQQQMAAAAALRVSNPMLAAMMANPLLNAPNMLQMQWNPLMQQRLPNLAMAALAQAVHNAHQNSGASSSRSMRAASGTATPTVNALAALAASMNPAAAAAMFSNPQMMRHIQQAQQAMQRNILLEYAKSQAKK